MPAPPPLHRADIERLYVNEGKTLQQTAEALGCTLDYLHRTMKRLGIPRRPAKVQPFPLTPEQIKAAYVERHATMAQAAKVLGCSRDQLQLAMRRLGIASKRGGKPAAFPQLHEPGWLAAQLATKSISDISREFGITPSAIHSAARAQGLKSAVYAGDSLRKSWAEGRHAGRPDLSHLTAETIREVYLDDPKATVRSAARALGCAESALRARMRALGLPSKQKARSERYRSAVAHLNDPAWLRAELKTKSQNQIARELGTTSGNVAAKVKRLGLSSGDTRRAGIAKAFPGGRFGETAANWRGGRRDSPSMPYVYIYAPENPNAVRGYVAEHRLVMEAHLGRVLEPGEEVHHRNGDKKDNRIENLELTDRGTHVRRHYDAVKDVERLEAKVAELEATIVALRHELAREKLK